MLSPPISLLLGSGYCPQAKQFFARVPGGLSTSYKKNYDTLFRGLIADGIYGALDVLCILATEKASAALLNLISPRFTSSLVNAPTFTANQGYAGNASSSYINTNYTPSTAGGRMTQNSIHASVYVRTSRATDQVYTAFGVDDASGYLYLQPKAAVGLANYDVGGLTFPNSASSNAQGFWSVNRTSSSAVNLYKNGSLLAGSVADTSGALIAHPVFIGALNNAGSPLFYSSDQIAAASLGGVLTTAQMALLSTRINNFMTSLGTNVY